MSKAKYYLKPSIQVEPLFDRWYAWSYLIPPGTAARNLTERHLKIMDSYIAVPQIHANAVKNPKMLGGPFIDYDGKRVGEIRALRDKTKSERGHLIELSAGISELDAMLRVNATGHSLHPLYAKIPPCLQGFVELVYDLNNNPSFRLLEPLLYTSKYYERSAQSLSMSITTGDERPFVLSTPRLDNPDSIELPIAFAEPAIDWLFSLKKSHQTFDAIVGELPVPEHKHELLHSMLTETPPKVYKGYEGNGIRWRYFGHACILVETNFGNVLFDPVLSYTYDAQLSRYTYADLPERLDFVVITHGHQDHLLFETILQIRHKVETFIVPASGCGALQDPSLKLVLKQLGCRHVVELRDMEEVAFGPGRIVALPFLGEHSDLNIPSKHAYLVRFGRHSLLFASDSCNVDPALYAHLHREIGDVDALFLGMECDGAPLSWLYGPLLTSKIDRSVDESRRLSGSDYHQGMNIIKQFKCKEAYVYAMGQEPWLNYVMSIKYTDESRPITESNRLIKECAMRGITAERLFGQKEILAS